MSEAVRHIELTLQDKQEVAFLSKANEILYGGAAGGGKSHLMRVCAIYWCLRVANFQAYFFRRHYEDLIKNHMAGPSGFRMMLAPLVESGDVTIVEKEIRFNKNNSKIFLCHCNAEDDVYQYWGAEIHAMFPDELTHFSERMYRFLRGRCRAIGLDVPEDLKGKFPCILAGSNPGNIGHQWVKSMFVDPRPALEVWRTPPEEGGMLRQFIPATLEDNPKLMEEDPTYENRLLGLGSEAYVKAIRFGSWDVLEGAFFTEFDRHKHVTVPFEVPKQWKRFRSFDWGFSKPFCCHWWAISDGDEVELSDGTKRAFPRNAIICYREWYGCVAPNVGMKLIPEMVANGIRAREKDEHFSYSVADPSIFKQDGGPSHGERMARCGVTFRPGDNTRQAGWLEMRGRLSAPDGPMIYFFNTCLHIIRTISVMQYDDVREEDLDTDGEDHACDSVRYACMSRPHIGKRKPKKTDRRMNLDELVKFNKEWNRREFRRKASIY